MKLKKGLIVSLIAFFPVITFAQKTDSLINKLDSLKQQTDTVGQQNLVEPAFYNESTKITPKVFGVLLLNDIKQQAVAPFHINKRGWVRGAVFTAAVFGMNFLDDPIQRWAVNLRTNNPWSEKYSHTITNIGGVYQVASFAGIAAYGFIFKNEKLRTTTYLATQSFITTSLWTTLFKSLSGRERPGELVNTNPHFAPGFHGPFYKLQNGNSAFPSGHTALAFAAATVYAKEYRYIPAIPILSYGIATLIGVSRITENRHWTTDILTGAALGILSGTQVVNNYHRYAKLQRTKGNKLRGKITANIQYLNRTIVPGIVYKF